MCLRDCRECREKAIQRRYTLQSILLGAFLVTLLVTMVLTVTPGNEGLFWLGAITSGGLLASVVACERS